MGRGRLARAAAGPPQQAPGTRRETVVMPPAAPVLRPAPTERTPGQEPEALERPAPRMRVGKQPEPAAEAPGMHQECATARVQERARERVGPGNRTGSQPM